MHPGLTLNLAMVFIAALSAGCATSEVIPMSTDTYMISQTSSGGVFRSMSSLKTEVIKRANSFAEGKGKVAVPIAATESPASPGHMPSFEYQFRLVDKDDPRASGGAMIPRADVVIENHGSNASDTSVKDPSNSKDIYSELLKLDDLRKKGIITEAEFEAQKAKLLKDN